MTAVMKTGWSNHKGYKCYYDINGHMLYGWQEIEGESYYFNKHSGGLIPELQKENGKIYYIENNLKYKGEKYIDGHWYYFSPEMVTGWRDFSNKKVYYNTDGTMCYGEKGINGKWYYFDKTTGAMIRGWYNLPGKKVYYGSDGAMVYGKQVIGGKTYYFNTRTGALLTNSMETKAQIYTSSTNWLILVDTKQNKVGIYRGKVNNWSEVHNWSCTTGASSTPTVKRKLYS